MRHQRITGNIRADLDQTQLEQIDHLPIVNISGNSLPVEALVDLVRHPLDCKVASMDFRQHLILLLLSEDHPPH